MINSQTTSRLQQVNNRIAKACLQYNKAPPLLLAVSKTREVDEINNLIKAGIQDFGENYLQEAIEKQYQLQAQHIIWHFIGPIQSNKTRLIAEHFHWVHSVDRLKIAQRLSKQRPISMPPLQICLQINIDNEDSKSGFKVNEALNAALSISKLPQIQLRGLMCIPKKCDDVTQQKQIFSQLSSLLQTINQQLPSHCSALDTLSMGMSADIEAAISEGSTIIRVGTALFGPRPKK